MSNFSLQNIRTILERNNVFKRLFDVLEKTPPHALHWYLLLLFNCIVMVVAVAVATLMLSTSNADIAAALQRRVVGGGIDRTKLNSALETYREHMQEFKQLQNTAPGIIDPGR